jgi:hypothetical protein
VRSSCAASEEPINPKKRILKTISIQRNRPTENLNSKIITGQKGDFRVINRNRVFAEFYDRNGNQIEWRNKIVFKIGMKQFKIKKNKNTTTGKVSLRPNRTMKLELNNVPFYGRTGHRQELRIYRKI